MKSSFLLSFLLLFCACSTVSEKNNTTDQHLNLKKISSSSKSRKKFGLLKAELRSKTGSLIFSDNASLGSCSDCVQGYSVSDLLGIKVVGNRNNLKAIRKHSNAVRIVDCPQGKSFGDEYSCSFKIQGQMYHLKLSLKS